MRRLTRPRAAAPAVWPLSRQTPDILVDGTRITVTWDEPMAGAGRPWFECPACARRARLDRLPQLPSPRLRFAPPAPFGAWRSPRHALAADDPCRIDRH